MGWNHHLDMIGCFIVWLCLGSIQEEFGGPSQWEKERKMLWKGSRKGSWPACLGMIDDDDEDGGPKNQLEVGWINSIYSGEITPLTFFEKAIYRGFSSIYNKSRGPFWMVIRDLNSWATKKTLVGWVI